MIRLASTDGGSAKSVIDTPELGAAEGGDNGASAGAMDSGATRDKTLAEDASKACHQTQ